MREVVMTLQPHNQSAPPYAANGWVLHYKPSGLRTETKRRSMFPGAGCVIGLIASVSTLAATATTAGVVGAGIGGGLAIAEGATTVEVISAAAGGAALLGG